MSVEKSKIVATVKTWLQFKLQYLMAFVVKYTFRKYRKKKGLKPFGFGFPKIKEFFFNVFLENLIKQDSVLGSSVKNCNI